MINIPGVFQECRRGREYRKEITCVTEVCNVRCNVFIYKNLEFYETFKENIFCHLDTFYLKVAITVFQKNSGLVCQWYLLGDAVDENR